MKNAARRITGVAAKSCSRMHNRHLACIRRTERWQAGEGDI